MKMKYFIALCFIGSSAHAAQEDEWAWAHRKIFSENELVANKSKTNIIYAKTDLTLFNQLLFSWNALRPAQGHFSFYVQVRDANTKKWTHWYKMMQWGGQRQHSFSSDDREAITYVHVRLETGKHYADAFRIKIDGHQKADLSLIRSFVLALSDWSKFNSEEEAVYNMPSVILKQVPMQSQFALDHPRASGLCSPTSCSMLSSYLLQRPIDSLAFAEKAYDYGLGVYGSWPFNIAHAYELCEGKFWFSVVRLHSFKQLYARLMRNMPVAVSVRGPLIGSATPYASGHLLLVIGWDNKTKEVICHDPAFQAPDSVLKRYPLKDFLIAWERSRRLAYAADQIFER